MHDCWNCQEACDCDGEDVGGQPQPDDCRCPCFENDWPTADTETEYQWGS
jgi:hypothetical protein